MGYYEQKALSLLSRVKKILVFAFFFFLPTQLAKHFWPPWSYVQGMRVDYLAPSISILDVISLLVVIVHISLFVQLLVSTRRRYFVILGLLIVTNTLFSSHPLHTLLFWSRFIFYTGVVLLLVRRGEMYFGSMLMGLSLGSVVQLILVLLQFINQSSLQGVWYWLGERRLVLSLPDVAKISVRGREYLRPYGTFSHPNALGGFYALLFFFIRWIKPQLAEKRLVVLANLILLVCPFLVLLTFSKVAIFSIVLGSLVLVWGDYTYRKCLLCLIARSSVLILIFLMFALPIGDPYSLQKRMVLMGNSVQIFLSHPLWGVGLGNFIRAQSSLSIIPRYMPLYQPVHNIFLLILTEIGVGGAMLVYYFTKQIRLVAFWGRDTLPIFLTLLITGLFDHYWITQPQTQVLSMFVVLSIFLMHPAVRDEGKKRPL